jgi:hypothetical protein
MGWLQDLGGGISKGFKSATGFIGNLATGLAPKVGLGQYKGDEYKINEDAYLNPKQFDLRRKQLEEQRAGINGRNAQQINYQPASSQSMNAAQLGSASLMSPEQQQFRGGQAGLVQDLQNQANGIGPSLAQQQLQQGTEANINSAMALGASQRGLTAGQNLRNISDQTANANQQAAQNAANLRLQEQMLARGQLGNVLQGARGQDIGVGSENMNAQNQFALHQGSMNQQANLANMGAANQMNQFNAANQLGAQQSNQQASLQQQQLNDALQRYYQSGIIDQDLAQMMSAQDLERLKLQEVQGRNQVNAPGFESAQNRVGGFIGKLGQMGAGAALGGMGGGGLGGAGKGALGAI